MKPAELHVVEGSESGQLLGALTSFAVSDGCPLTFHASLLPSRTVEFVRLATDAGISVQAHAGNGVVHGHLPDSVLSVDAAVALIQPLRDFIQNGSATAAPGPKGGFTVLNCSAEWRSSFAQAGGQTTSTELMKKVKQSLDPRNVFPRGGMIPP